MEARGIKNGIELSGIADVSASTVSLYLKGKRGRRMNSQSMATVRKFAAALGVDPDYFPEHRQVTVRRMADEVVWEGILDPEDFAAYLEVQRGLWKGEARAAKGV
ncbi:MAG: helix-turn-helix transcriptional regulator [Actinobacteria bacterium]|nr:helix-turn-helix transcriptional regulator [Actinomycetota bacterium]